MLMGMRGSSSLGNVEKPKTKEARVKFSMVETVSELSFVLLLLLTETSALPLELEAAAGAVSSLVGGDRDALGGNVGGEDDDVSDEEAVDSMLVMLAL